MPDDPDTDALERFARDLRRIREDREVSLAMIAEATQIRESHLQSFEAGKLHDKPRMNPVYLRAFVRAYADALDLPPDSVVEFLNASLSGTYQNELSVEYLNAPPSDAAEETSSESSDESPPDGEAQEPPPSSHDGAEEESPRSSASRTSSDTESPTNTPESPTAEPSEGTDSGSIESAEAAGSVEEPFSAEDQPPAASRSSESAGPSLSSAQVDSPDRESPGRPSTTTSSGNGSTASWPARRSILIVAGIGLVLVVIAVGVSVGLFSDGSEPTSDPAQEPLTSVAEAPSSPEAPADTVENDTTPPQRPLADITLGDTLHVTVLATSDVRELRVQQDDNLRRPYWIREGEAMVFPFTRRITLQNQLDSLRLLLERYPYPDSRTDEEGRVVITRDTAEQYVDTLRGSPVPVPESPDTSFGTGPPAEPES